MEKYYNHTKGVDISSVKSMWECLHKIANESYSMRNYGAIRYSVKMNTLGLTDGEEQAALDAYYSEPEWYGDCLDSIIAAWKSETGWRVNVSLYDGYIVVDSDRTTCPYLLPDETIICDDYDSAKRELSNSGINICDIKREYREDIQLVRDIDELCCRLRSFIKNIVFLRN